MILAFEKGSRAKPFDEVAAVPVAGPDWSATFLAFSIDEAAAYTTTRQLSHSPWDGIESCLAEYGDDFAIFGQRDDGEVMLARPPLSSIPLFYRHDGAMIRLACFASDLGGRLDPAGLLEPHRSGGGRTSDRTGFKGVRSVRPGSCLRGRNPSLEERIFLPLEIKADTAGEGAAIALRSGLHEAVGRVLPAGDSLVASQLSGGRDSSAVTACAALALHRRGGTVAAFTYAPERPIEGHAVYRFDESGTASAVAGRFDNVRHVVLKNRRQCISRLLDEKHRMLERPMAGLHNLGWWNSIEAKAAEMGASVLLTGSSGNMTISYGGPRLLADLLAQGQYRRWWRTLKACRQFSGASLLSLIDMSLGSRIPKALYRVIRKVRRAAQPVGANPFYRGELALREREGFASDDPRPDARPRENWKRDLQHGEVADLSASRIHGLLVRDPTADRRLAEIMLSLSTADLASAYDQRPVYAAAFGALLPDEVLRPVKRGSQGADWVLSIDRNDLVEAIERYRTCDTVREWIDTDALISALADWPDQPQPESGLERFFMDRVFPAICVASFIYVNSPAPTGAGSGRALSSIT